MHLSHRCLPPLDAPSLPHARHPFAALAPKDLTIGRTAPTAPCALSRFSLSRFAKCENRRDLSLRGRDIIPLTDPERDSTGACRGEVLRRRLCACFGASTSCCFGTSTSCCFGTQDHAAARLRRYSRSRRFALHARCTTSPRTSCIAAFLSSMPHPSHTHAIHLRRLPQKT